MHSHHQRPSPQVFIAGGRALYVGPGLALSPPGALHLLRADTPMVVVYLDALSDDCASLTDTSWPPEGCVPAVTSALASGPVDSLDPAATIRAVLAAIGVPPRRPSRLAATLHAIERSPQSFPRIDDAARHAGLSASRFRHVFREEVGLPFRRYRLWRRMARVASAVAAGRSLTGAAFEAGFASSAHLSAAFREMFGLPPSALIKLGTRFAIATDLPSTIP